MQIIDTHSHIYDKAFGVDREMALKRAAGVGVCKIVLPAIDSESHDTLFDLARKYPDRCFPMMGLHPTSINDNPKWRDELKTVEKYLENPPEGIAKFCAVGEVGLDLYWSQEWEKEQTEAFESQIELSIKHDLPLAIHTRAAWPQMVRTLAKYRDRGLRGVLHAYSGEYDHYTQIKDYGDFLLGIGGVVTYKNSGLPDLMRKIPIQDIVLETDCPYLTPVPFRGKRNESSYLIYILHKVAEIYAISIDDAARITTQNAEQIFKI